MISYNEIIKDFPSEIQLPMMKFMDQLKGEILNTVTKEDFRELKQVVSDLSQCVSDLSVSQLEIIQIQKSTETRIDTLSVKMEELAEAQRKTESRVDTLSVKMGELAEAQRKTENVLKGVIKRQDKMSKEIGGLANSFGYVLENEAIRYLPDILQKTEGINIRVIDRRFIVYPDGQDDEINIYAEGVRNGENIFIIGESKAQMGKKDVNRFEKLLARVSKHLASDVWPLFITHSVHPDVESYAKNRIQGLSIYKSYDLKAMSSR